jgi:hypothetical protein
MLLSGIPCPVSFVVQSIEVRAKMVRNEKKSGEARIRERRTSDRRQGLDAVR